MPFVIVGLIVLPANVDVLVVVLYAWSVMIDYYYLVLLTMDRFHSTETDFPLGNFIQKFKHYTILSKNSNITHSSNFKFSSKIDI